MATHDNNFNQSDYNMSLMLRKQRWRRGIVITLLFLLFIFILSFQLIRTNYQRSEVKEQIRTSQVGLSKQKNTQSQLQTNVKQLNNTEYLEQLIREKNYYTKDGETVYSLPGDVAKDVTRN